MKIGTVTAPATGSNIAPAAQHSGSAGSSGTPRAAAQAPPPQTAPVAAPKSSQTSVHVAMNAARQINDFLKSSSAGLEFKVDGDSKRVVVRIVDSETGKVIRQIPTEEMLAIAQSLEHAPGVLFELKA